MKITMIVNPNAGMKKGLSVAEKSAERLRQKGNRVDMLVSRRQGESRTLAENLALQDLDAVLSVGGDGTLFDVINGLIHDRETIPVILGQIPVGTGNSFIKDLGIETVEDAIEKIEGGKSRPVDLGEFSCPEGRFYFVNLLGTGFVSNVAYRAKGYKRLGALAYIMAVLEEIIVLSSSSVEIEMDGKKICRQALFTEICNSRYTGGAMMMAPSAAVHDGLLDIILLNRISRLRVLTLFPSIFRGKHVKDPAVESFRARRVTLHSDKALLLTPDGETFGSTPIDVRIHPGRIRMFC